MDDWLAWHRALLKLLTHGASAGQRPVTVREIMTLAPLTVSSTTPTLEAMAIMRQNRVGCLPVLDDGRLVGIVTSYDFLDASARLFKEQLTTRSDALIDNKVIVARHTRTAGVGSNHSEPRS